MTTSKPSAKEKIDALFRKMNLACVKRSGRWEVLEMRCGTCIDGHKCEKRAANGHVVCGEWR